MKEHPLISDMRTKMYTALKRKAVTTCSRWAEMYRVMGMPAPGPWTFRRTPWTREMHDCTAPTIIGQKAAQMGFTEVALNMTFFKIDVQGISCLYVLPNRTPAASNFSTSRFDPALELSPHLSSIFSDVKNVMHKRAGSASLFIRGSRSKTDLKSDPVGFMVFDELEEMVQENIPLAFERMSGQDDAQKYLLSTPTIEGHGINVYFKGSTQNVFFFRCPHCSRYIDLEFPRNLKVTSDDYLDPRIQDSYLFCHYCQGVLKHEEKQDFLVNNEWVPTHTDRTDVGFTISQLYSTAASIPPSNIAISYLKGLQDPAHEQEFYNSKLGITHTTKGSQITDSEINECIGTHKMFDGAKMDSFITMGVDVGKFLHVEIDQWFRSNSTSADANVRATPRIIKIVKVVDFEELDALMFSFGVNMCTVDANPETRKALEFSNRFVGHVYLCYYGNNVKGKDIIIGADDNRKVTVDRTSWLDLSLGRFHNKKVILPLDVTPEYRQHLKALVRVYRLDQNENPIGTYVKEYNRDDHFAHARNYAEIAFGITAGMGRSEDVKKDPL